MILKTMVKMFFECENYNSCGTLLKLNGDLKHFCDLSMKNGMEWEFLGIRAFRDISY